MSEQATAECCALLLVEDNPADVRLVRELLKDSCFEGTVTAVENGRQALDALRAREGAYDIVLTDLQMPGINGLELVEEAQRAYPSLPVVLMTAFGNEEIAFQALKKGAVSYVPKGLLGRELAATIRDVLEVCKATRDRRRLFACLTRSESEFCLANDPALIPPLIGHLGENLDRIGRHDEAERFHVGMALYEALTNAMFHGNLEMPSSLREEDEAAYYGLAARRRGESPYAGRLVHVIARETRDEVVYIVRDEGPGFRVGSVPDPAEAANLDKVSGRGLLLIRTFMDKVFHNETGNQITMVKQCSR